MFECSPKKKKKNKMSRSGTKERTMRLSEKFPHFELGLIRENQVINDRNFSRKRTWNFPNPSYTLVNPKCTSPNKSN